MSLKPDINDLISRARADLRMGLPVVLQDDHKALIVAAAETLTPKRLQDLKVHDSTLTLVITDRRATTLKAPVYEQDIARIAVPHEAGLNWISGVADPSKDLALPLKGPFNIKRTGHTELHRLAIQLVKSARLLPAVITQDILHPSEFATHHLLTVLFAQDVAVALDKGTEYTHIISARLPMEVSEDGRLHVFRPEDGGEEHYAIEIGTPARAQPVLARLHSACFTGDLMGSLKCDCGPQLRAALAQMGEEGAGVLLYLNQEGRGIGLANKMRAYSLQDQGFDTVEANHRLGFEDDERDFRIGAALLTRLGFSSLRLLTNNPAKISMMERCGIKVSERVPLHVGENHHNHGYLQTKARKSGHMLE